MIKPPAMGVFARDPPSAGKAGASSSSSSALLQSLPTELPPSHHDSPSLSTNQADLPPSDPLHPDDDAAQDDDDQGTVDEEAGVIRCICGSDDDDGFTIQCDRCLVWQHCACFGMSQASVPDEYLCEQCEPRPVDVAFAQAHQQKRKNNEARKVLMDRNLKRQAQALASTTYNQPHLSSDSVASPTSSTHPAFSSLTAEDSSLSSQSVANLAPPSATAARSRKPSQALDLTNTQFVVPELPASVGATHKGAKQRKGHKGSRRGYDTPSSVSTPVRGVFTPGSSHERNDDPFDLADQLEAWHVEFTPIARNMVADPAILDNLAVAMLDWEDGSPLKALPGPAGRVIVPTAPRHSAASTKLSHSELHPSSSTSSPSSSSPRALGSPSLDAELVGISAVGQECVPIELTGPTLADLACRTYVRHISESASAGVFSNLLYVNNSADEPQRGWCASRAFSRPVMHGLFADGAIPTGAFISELRGELYSADAYRNNPINQYAALGATKPHVHLLPPPLNLAIDARRYGNEARFARFSCHPNAVIRPILFYPNGQPSARSRTSSRAQSPSPAAAFSSRYGRYADTPPVETRAEEPQLLFGLFALTDIPRTHEITVGWEWDDAHIVHFLPELVQNPYLEPRHGDVDADQHTANMVALAGKGEFPYADTEFSVKMSTVAAALLGCVLCACIGSAAPPGGGGGASANNGRKQDCAVAQMLRVGNGMSLLNVTMPGKTNRRAKLPDFSPLVGIRRQWRPYSLPPTPETSVKDAASPADPALLAALAAEGEAQATWLLDDMDVDGEAGCAGKEAATKRRPGRKAGNSKHRKNDKGDLGSDLLSAAADSDDADDSRSIASSLTDPLSGLSDNETLSEDEDQDLMDAMRAANGLQPRRQAAKGGEDGVVDTELSGLFLLPPKKRSMRTRIKANMAPSDDEQAGDADHAHQEDADVPVKAVTGRRSADMPLKVKSVQKRKSKPDAGRPDLDFSSEEEKAYADYSAATPAKKRRKSGNIADPSSPLSSVPSPHSDISGLSPPPPVPRLSAKHRLENERRMSDVELSKKKRAAKRGHNGNAKAAESRPKESASRRRKREEARIHRNAILDLGDTESSEERLSDEDDSDTSNQIRDEDADITMADADSRASTPRATRTGATVTAKGDASSLNKITKKERLSTPTAAEDRKSAQKDTPTKTKKVRRILSDSEASSDEGTPAASTPTTSERQETQEKSTVEPSKGINEAKDAEAKTKTDEGHSEADHAAAGTASVSPATATAPAPEVKKEEPRVKLSLAEYKRRLAERRVSEQQGGNASATPLTPTLATPTSEMAPSPSPAIERSDPLPSPSARATELTVTATAAETVATPASLATPTPTSGVPDTAETSKASSSSSSSAVPRGVLFTSISAPTAIRSVEIPKSPSPEPATISSTQQQQQQQQHSGAASSTATSKETCTGAATTDEVNATAHSSTLGPASSPASSLGALPPTASSADTPALLMRLETRRGRAPSTSQQSGVGERDAQHIGSAGSVSADADGFAKPVTSSTGQAVTPMAITWGSAATSTPLRSPSLGPTRVQAGGRMPPSPSGTSTFNPPKAPRAFMSPPGSTLPPPSMTPASSSTHNASASAPVASAAPAATTTAAQTTSPAVTSTPARVGLTGASAGVGNTPSTASSISSTASSRYPAQGLTSPTPITTALPGSSGGYPPRNYAGVPKGPASMRDGDPRADAWAEAREAREARDARGADYGVGPRHHDAMREGGAGRDMGWGERSREPSGVEREPVRGGWGRERREVPRYARDGYFGRDEREPPSMPSSSVGNDAPGAAGSTGLADRPDASQHYGYRRPSAEYDERGYERAPEYRGIVVRGRSLGLGANAAAAREGRGGEYYDEAAAHAAHAAHAGHAGRGGFRSGAGWGGRSRPRGGRGRGGWMR